MVTLLMQGQRLLPGGCLVVKESPPEPSGTLSFKTRCGSADASTKKTTNVVLSVPGCCCARPIFASDAGLFGVGSPSGTFTKPSSLVFLSVNDTDWHSIGIIHQNSPRAFCIILFALMLFENLRGLKLANTFCRLIKWGREAQISTRKYHQAACHPHVKRLFCLHSTMVSTEKSRPFHSRMYRRAFSFSAHRTASPNVLFF